MLAGDPAAADRVRDVEGAVEHDIGDSVESARAQILGARDEVSGGIVDEVGQRAGAEDIFHHGVDCRRIADVDPIGLDVAAMFGGELGGGGLADRFAAAADENVGAEREKLLGHAFAEAGAAAGHQDAFAAKQSVLEHRSPSSCGHCNTQMSSDGLF